MDSECFDRYDFDYRLPVAEQAPPPSVIYCCAFAGGAHEYDSIGRLHDERAERHRADQREFSASLRSRKNLPNL